MPTDVQTWSYYGALGLISVPAFYGARALVRPESAIAHFGFPLPADPAGRKVALGMTRIYGSRNVVIAAVMSIMWWTDNKRLLGLCTLPALGMALTDGFVSKAITGGGEWEHWGFIPVAIGLAAGLLQWI